MRGFNCCGVGFRGCNRLIINELVSFRAVRARFFGINLIHGAGDGVATVLLRLFYGCSTVVLPWGPIPMGELP